VATGDPDRSEKVSGDRPVDADDLRRLAERYELAARGANDGLWDWDITAGTMYYSPRWKSMLGFEEHEIADSPDEWFERIHPDDIEELLLQTYLFAGFPRTINAFFTWQAWASRDGRARGERPIGPPPSFLRPRQSEPNSNRAKVRGRLVSRAPHRRRVLRPTGRGRRFRCLA